MEDKQTDGMNARFNTQTFFIVQDGDFTAQELLALDALTSNTLADARWALDRSAFIATFNQGDNPYPMMSSYTAYTNMSLQPILSQYPWSLPF